MFSCMITYVLIVSYYSKYLMEQQGSILLIVESNFPIY